MPTPTIPRPLLVVTTGHTWDGLRERLGDFSDWIAAGLQGPGGTRSPVQHCDATLHLPPPAAGYAGVVLTGSHAMVSDHAPWSEALAQWLRDAVHSATQVLGICYGHQLLAHALGGEVGYHPGGLEVGTVDVHTTPAAAHDPVLGALPGRFAAAVVHAQTVLRPPPGATVLAHNPFEPHHALRMAPRAWGVQFHPEFPPAALPAYLDELAPALDRQGISAPALRAHLRPTPEAAHLLPRFARCCAAWDGARA